MLLCKTPLKACIVIPLICVLYLNHNAFVFFSGAFNLYDLDQDGYITKQEMLDIVDAIYKMVVSTEIPTNHENTVSFRGDP